MSHVLSWGACPTVIKGPRLKMHRWQWADWTACAWTRSFRSANAARLLQELLAYGSAPWRLCRMHLGICDPDAAGRVPMALQGTLDPVWEAQWWRWHARRARRLWAMVQFHK